MPTGSGHWITPERREAIYRRDGYLCAYCGRDLSLEPASRRSLDHLEAGHTDHRNENLVTCCLGCNGGKCDADWRTHRNAEEIDVLRKRPVRLHRSKKKDHGDLAAKLALRRQMLASYHGDGAPFRVLDACQGAGTIWGALRVDFPAARVTGLDRKAKAGRLRMDSVRLLASGRWDFDVIDVDTYGSPWRHWEALLATARRPVLVFLTHGQAGVPAASNVPREVSAAMGLDGLRRLPPTLRNTVGTKFGASYVLVRGVRASAVAVTAACQTQSRRGHGLAVTRYYGLRLEPKG